jgi:hypothetical protein
MKTLREIANNYDNVDARWLRGYVAGHLDAVTEFSDVLAALGYRSSPSSTSPSDGDVSERLSVDNVESKPCESVEQVLGTPIDQLVEVANG